MEKLSKRLLKISPSATVAMNQKSQDLQAQGIDIINLSVGEPDFFTPDHIKSAAKSAIDDNFTHYSPVAGYPELRKAISEKLRKENKLQYSPDQIIVSNGAKHSVANALLCLIDNGDEVVVPAPYWVSYVELVKLAGGINVIINASIENDFKISPEQLDKAITPKTKALILCSPSNPTGSVYNRSELKEIAKVLAKHDHVFIIADEIYERINFVGAHESIGQFPEIFERVILINGVSKGYAMTGWRIGYLAGPLWLASACNKLQGQITTGPSSISQKASYAALTQSDNPTREMCKAFQRRRDLVVELLGKIEGIKLSIPQGAFYVFPDVSYYFNKSNGENTIKGSLDFCTYLLETGHIATVPGIAFGNDNCIRISYATSDEKIIEAISRLKHAVAKLS